MRLGEIERTDLRDLGDLHVPRLPRGLVRELVSAAGRLPQRGVAGLRRLFADRLRRIEEVPRGREGLNVLTNQGGNVEGDEKVSTIRSLAGNTKLAGGDKAIAWLETTLRHHGAGGSVPLCVHFPGGGTVSSTILALHNADPGQHVLLYANGNPCENPYRDYSELLRQLNPGKL